MTILPEMLQMAMALRGADDNLQWHILW